MLSRGLILALLVGFGVPAVAQKPVPVSPYELGSDPVEAVSADGSTYLRTARPALLTALDVPVADAPPEAQARAFLGGYRSPLGLRHADTADLALTRVRQGHAGTAVRFRQTVGGVPVWGPETVVHIDARDRVQYLANGYRADLEAVDVTPSVTEGAARARVYAHLGVDGAPFFEATELVVWPSTPARLAWRVQVEGETPLGSFEGLVDAHTGELIRVADRTLHRRGGDDPVRPTALPLVELAPRFVVDGTAMIFDPNPLTRAGVSYGATGYTDGTAPGNSSFCASPSNYNSPNCDVDSPQLTAARTAVTLRDITFDGTNYTLVGPWAEIMEFEAPVKGLFAQASSDWNFTRNAEAFEGATTYWHIDNYMRYVNVVLGIDATPQLYSTGVRFDAHGLSGQDNSHYLPGSDRLAFGEGCVDDNEDADVIIHELGHGLHDWLAGAISNSTADGLSEGFGDYVAVSYTRSLGLLQPSDAAYDWVFKWDGHNPCWGGRRTDVTTNYPAGGPLHGVGQNWSTALMRVWDVIGRERTDTAVFEGMALGNSQTTQPQAAQAVLQVAADMGYSDAELTAFFDSFVEQGYNVTFPVSNEVAEAAEAAGVLLTEPAPNPFNGLTTFDVLVDAPQAVTVEVFDAVGRRVATLFDGEMTAGQRFPVALAADGLRSGVYVVRVTGATVTASRRVTVVR